MKIAVDARLYGLKHAGIGRYVENLLTQLCRIDNKNYYTIIGSPGQKMFPLPKHHRIITSPIKHYTLSEQTLFLNTLNQLDCDLIHFPHFNVPVLYHRPFIVTIHDLLWHEKIGFQATTLHPLLYLLKYAGYRLVIKKAIHKSLHIITPAHTVKKAIIDTFAQPPAKISVTYEAAASHFHHQDPLLPKILKKYHLTQPFLIYTGSLYPHKNVEQVVLALKSYPAIQFAVVSARNAFTQKFTSFVQRHQLTNQVKILGYVPDAQLKQLYYHALALIQPSLSEGFGLTGLEAMACGLPVVCSNHPTLKEIYRHQALFVDTKNPQSISSAIHRLNSESQLTHKLSVQGKSRAAQFSWQKTASQTLAIYQQVYNSLKN